MGMNMPGRGAYGNKQAYLRNKAYRGPGGAFYFINKHGKHAKMKNDPRRKGFKMIANPYKTGLLSREKQKQASVNPIRPVRPQAKAPGAPSRVQAPLDPRSAHAYKQMMLDVLRQFNADTFSSQNEMAKIHKDGKFHIFEKLFGRARDETQQRGWRANAHMAGRGVGRSGAKVKLAQELRSGLDHARDEYDRQFGKARFDDLRAAIDLAKKQRLLGENQAINAGAEELASREVTPDDADYGGGVAAAPKPKPAAPKPKPAAPAPVVSRPQVSAKPKVSGKQRRKAQAYHDQLRAAFRKSKSKREKKALYQKMLTMRQKYGAK